jgi:hypothetical protein
MGVAGTKAVPALLYVDSNGLNEVRGDGAGKLIGKPFVVGAGVVDAAPGNYVSGGLHGLVVLIADSRGAALYLQDQFDDKTLSAAKPIATTGLNLDRTCRLFSGDFNGDSFDDFGLFCQAAPGTIWIAVNDGQGDFVVTAYQLSGVAPASSVFAQDINQDGKSDLIVTSQGQPSNDGTITSVLFSKGNGFSAGSVTPLATNSVLSVGDIFGNGTIALLNYTGGTGTALSLTKDSGHQTAMLPQVDNGCVVLSGGAGSLINQYRGVLAKDIVLAETCGSTAKLVSKGNPASSIVSMSVSKSLSRGLGLAKLSVSVRGVNSASTPSGSVRVMVDQTPVGSVTRDRGEAAINIALGSGKHTVTSVYEGDNSFSEAAGVLVVHNRVGLVAGSRRNQNVDSGELFRTDYKVKSGSNRFVRVAAAQPAFTVTMSGGGLSILNPSVQNCSNCGSPGAPVRISGTTITAGSGYVIGDDSITGQNVYNDCPGNTSPCEVQQVPIINTINVLIDGISAGTATTPNDDSTYVQCGDPSGFTESCQQGSLYSYFSLPGTLAPGHHTIVFNIVGGSGTQQTDSGTATVTYTNASESFTFTLVQPSVFTTPPNWTTPVASPSSTTFGNAVTTNAQLIPTVYNYQCAGPTPQGLQGNDGCPNVVYPSGSVVVRVDGVQVGTATATLLTTNPQAPNCGSYNPNTGQLTAYCDNNGFLDVSYTTGALTPGTHTISFVFVPNGTIFNITDSGNNPAQFSYASATSPNSNVITITGRATPTLSVTCNPNPISFGSQSTTCTTSLTGATSPTGFLTWTYTGPASGLLASGAPLGVSQTGFAGFPVGVYTLTVAYSGDTANSPATGSTHVTIIKSTPGASTFVLISSPNPSVYAQTVTFTATFSGLNPAPTGTVQFVDGGTVIGSSSLSGGVATFSTQSLAVGAHLVVALYSGDGNYNGVSSNTDNQAVNPASVTVTVSGVPNPSGYTQNVTITVQLTPPPGGVVPTGSVTITDGSTTLGVVNLNGSGGGTLNIATLSVGNHAIVGAYNGDTNYY